MDATEAALDSPLNGCEPNAASVLKGWRTFRALAAIKLPLRPGRAVVVLLSSSHTAKNHCIPVVPLKLNSFKMVIKTTASRKSIAKTNQNSRQLFFDFKT